ncbi:para-nitrobenzyl esterase [Ophiostoma piceae UAMH 11346]|uniref:Carboxylic ester hydrolase n=1 Tax=Ophiostoma piceae (strain UAMH 11346) TaxID=1262450 RepID=S3CE63_OPHP1|nr:para-nitrobenzyl esterase [Ophiostoma piceae UAMH 11346]
MAFSGTPHPDTSRASIVQVGSHLAVKGFINPSTNIANYLGIKFASVPARFRQSKPVPLESFTGELDATDYGPRCPQPADKPKALRQHLYNLNRDSASVPEDEHECLVLNVYTPPNAEELVEQRGKPLPVFVWIHGGGWTIGDGGPDYDGNWQVAESIELGKPFIFVAINYRLGYYGFLTSKELKAEADQNGETWFANPGVYDQRLGLEWVQKYIRLFGGNPDEVTISGESAGAWSVMAHIVSDVPVCQRGLILSMPLLEFRTADVSQDAFDGLVQRTGLSASATPEAKLAAVRTLSNNDMMAALGGKFATPNWDPAFFPDLAPGTPLDSIKSLSSWVKSVIIGSTKHEGVLFGIPYRQWAAKDIHVLLDRILPEPTLRSDVLSAYGFDPNAPLDDTLTRIYKLLTDSMFDPAPSLIGELSSDAQPVAVYRFDQTDTFPDHLYHNTSYHSLDNTFICRLPTVASSVAPPEMQKTADRMSEAVATFVYGSLPWEPFHKGKPMYVFDGSKSGLYSDPPFGEEHAWEKFRHSEQRWAFFKALGSTLIRSGKPQ